MDDEVNWPSREQVLEAFDAERALQDLLVDVDCRSVALEMSSKRFAASARNELAPLIGMRNVSRLTAPMVEQMISTVRANGNFDALHPLLHGWVFAFDSDGSNADWIGLLTGHDNNLTVRSRKDSLRVEGLIRHVYAAQPSLGRAGLLAAIMHSRNPVPALAMLARHYQPAAEAAALLSANFSEVPGVAAWSPLDADGDGEVAEAPQAERDRVDLGSNTAGSDEDAAFKELHAAGSPEDRLSAAEILREEAPELARLARGAADKIESGVPQPGVGQAIIDWSARAVALVGPEMNLVEFADAQRLEIAAAKDRADQAVAQVRELNELLAKVETLELSGMTELIPTLLAPTGYETVEDVRAQRAILSGEPVQQPALPDDDAEVPSPSLPAPLVTAAWGLDEPLASENDAVNPDTDAEDYADDSPSILPESEAEPVDEPEVPEQVDADRTTRDAWDVAAVPDAAGTDLSAPAHDELPGTTRGSDGIVTELIANGRELVAVHVLQNAGDERRVRLAKVLAAVFNCRPEVLEIDLMNLLLGTEEVAALEPDDVRVYLSAGIRAGLALGYAPIPLQPLVDRAALDDHPVGRFIADLEPLATRGFTRPRTANISTVVGPGDWQKLTSDAAQLRTSLAKITINYQRAGAVVRYLARNNQELGGALTALESFAQSQAAGTECDDSMLETVRRVAGVLRDFTKRERLIEAADAAVSTPGQTRRPIEANARDRLHTALDNVADTLNRGLEMLASAESAAVEPTGQDTAAFETIRSRIPEFDAASPGDASFLRLFTWIVDGIEPIDGDGLERQLEKALLPVATLPRDLGQHPTREPNAEELETLISAPAPADVFRSHLAVGNLNQAQTLLESVPVDERDELDDELQLSKRDWRKRFEDLLTAARRVSARLSSLDDDEETRRLAIQLEDGATPITGRYDLSVQEVEAAVVHGKARLASIQDELRERASALSEPQGRDRIMALIAGEDEPLAVEWLALAETGEALPVANQGGSDDFTTFFPDVVTVSRQAKDARGAIAAVHQHLKFEGHLNDQMQTGLASWTGLAAEKQQREVPRRMADVLRMLGLIPVPQNWIREVTKTKLAGYASWEVKASPVDGSYVPSLGSQANGSYDVTLVWANASPERLFDYVDSDRRHRPQILFYFGTLTPQQRGGLRSASTRMGFSLIVVDHAVVSWLSTRREPGWKLTQRVTLPFTSINPYMPAGGEVPEEMFVGRSDERREIVDPNGSMFVYGGRQLGKSALLRRVERGLRGSDEAAIYFDLKTAGVGDASPASMLWAKLDPMLAEAGIVHSATGTKSRSSEAIISDVDLWLQADESRRLLILLDEADNFLTSDAQNKFPTLYQLKGLMESSGRRFKVVFAGLHQVQRFHNLPNNPVVHGGRDILIGPLSTTDARELVVGPLTALGYEFESPETVWRLLLLTNYQASLIQIICNALIDHVRAEQIPVNGRIAITNKHVDEIYQNKDVRKRIEDRFRWTIYLDSRYRMIALVTALLSKGAPSGATFAPSDLHDQCEYFWPDGFARRILDSRQFERYLEELVGLGILRESNEEFGLRSPNILNLLGSQESIESELLEASSVMRLEMTYNPSVHRRVLRLEANGDAQMAPVSDADLARLVDHGNDAPPIQVVAGTPALGISRVPAAIELVANEKRVRCVGVGYEDLDHLPQAKSDDHFVVDLTGLAPTDGVLKKVLSTLERARTFATIVVDVTRLDLDRYFSDLPRIQIRKWSSEGLHSLQDSPFSTPADVENLRSVTGGWPGLVEEVLRAVARGASTEEAVTTAADSFKAANRATTFLRDAGAPVEELTRWARLFGSSGGRVQVEPIALSDLEDLEVTTSARSLVSQLIMLDLVEESGDGWLVDSVAAEMARSLDHDG